MRKSKIKILRDAGPAEFGGTRAGVGVPFGGAGAEDFVGDGGVGAVGFSGLKRFFDAAILAGVEGEDGNAAAGVQAVRQVAEKSFERGEFVVHGDAQRLEDAAHGEVGGFFVLTGQGIADGAGKFEGGAEIFSSERLRERGGFGFIGVFCQDFCERVGFDFFEEGGSGLAALGIHAHVERAIELGGEATRGIVDLHGGQSEVSEDEVGAGEVVGGEDLRKSGEIGAVRGENVFVETEGAEAGFGFGELDRIGIESEKLSGGCDAGKNLLGMASVTECAIDCGMAGLWGENLENFGDHNGPMRAGGRFARVEDLLDGLSMASGIVFLVFIRKTPGMFAGVTRTSFVRRLRSCVVHIRQDGSSLLSTYQESLLQFLK